ncbi:MAG: hypothetical protein ABIK31_05410 [candidate division WOR-3 bacterium]
MCTTGIYNTVVVDSTLNLENVFVQYSQLNKFYDFTNFYYTDRNLFFMFIKHCQNYDYIKDTTLPYFTLQSIQNVSKHKRIYNLLNSVYVISDGSLNLEVLNRFVYFLDTKNYRAWKFKFVYDFNRVHHPGKFYPNVTNFYIIYDKKDLKFYSDYLYVLSYKKFLVIDAIFSFSENNLGGMV